MALMRKKGDRHRALMRTSGGNRPLERPRHRYDVYLESVLKIEWEGVEWTDSVICKEYLSSAVLVSWLVRISDYVAPTAA